MFEALDRQAKLTRNQHKLIAAAILGFTLEFLDYFLIAFVLAFVTTPWHLSFGISAVILLSSGIGSIAGSAYFGHLADRIGRRRVFMITIAVFSLPTLALCFTPDSADTGWLYLAGFRLLIGFGAGGLVCVDLPLVQEFMPASKRGRVSGLITSSVPIAFLLGSLLVTWVSPYTGWRGLMGVCFALSLLTLLIRSWVPESPRWLMSNNRVVEARNSVGWALQVDPERLPLDLAPVNRLKPRLRDLLQYPRSLLLSWFTNLGAQTGYYGLTLWTPTLLVQILHITPQQAAAKMVVLTLSAFAGRVTVSFMSEKIGRRGTGIICSMAAAIALVFAAYSGDAVVATYPVFLLLLVAAYFFGDGGFAVVAPYAAEVWPTSLRATGMGSAYGFGGIGKIIGPLGLALVIGSSNLVLPQASSAAIMPAFTYFAAWYALAALTYIVFGFESRNCSIEAIDNSLRMHGRVPQGMEVSAKVAAGTSSPV